VAQSSNIPAGFISGLVIGLVVGGTLLALLIFILIAGIVNKVDPNVSGGWWLALGAVPATGLGWLGIVRTKKATDFLAGLLIGLAGGLLGATAICSLIAAPKG
jgi:hypothetical protein